MGIFFGTDGIRGKVNDELTVDLAYRCGNALGSSGFKPNILIGCDTRISNSLISLCFASGALSAGANVTNIGVCPTAGIAYLGKKLGFDYSVVISASHNPPEYNGIKIFNKDGFKLGDKNEALLEQKFVRTNISYFPSIGKYYNKPSLVKRYEEHLLESCGRRLDGLKVVIDASNGAAYKIAPSVFKKLGATVIKTGCLGNGLKINEGCGSLHPENLAKKVLLHSADVGFAFDGDSDRIIACDESGNILDGDIILFMLARYLKMQAKLKRNMVVGTTHTNGAIEERLKKDNILLLRSDIGDKYVIEKIEELGLSLGGEKSGHIILRDCTTTGDGILTALVLSKMLIPTNKPLSALAKIDLYPQVNKDVEVRDKMRIINSQTLSAVVDSEQARLGKNAKIMVRVSGTEPKIRIMVECNNLLEAKISALKIEKTVKLLNN